jgi:hypothetical protein
MGGGGVREAGAGEQEEGQCCLHRFGRSVAAVWWILGADAGSTCMNRFAQSRERIPAKP